MLFHLSIEADRPQHVASVLAEFMGGEACYFPPVAEGSWVAIADDDRGTIIEVYPRGTEIHQGEGDAVGLTVSPRRHNATHVALGTKLDQDAVMAICAREGWPAKYCRRGGQFGGP